ncbi:protein-glutamine gamma-glutamyltransferase [Peribacillus glennii]|uniref:Protein-glutamine gamma-glutamyltransferase n=1 Tax=Peribacillus glennii TaxID=2303991 RepID=A0A372LG44_9BACI|nr:protein-glutamine gamma-glutamyltransferase [Peribacillus glennii]RFU65270.1 protein-glutamine gamma-glutamyltransferase [Peribacillus glennii]
MIKINQQWVDASQIQFGFSSGRASEILRFMSKYSNVYEFKNMEQLEFEVAIRLQVIEAALVLHKSGIQFSTIADTKCNPAFWRLTAEGACILQPFALPHAAIEDVFLNGRLYAFECATAIVIIFYKAVLKLIGREQFDELFRGLYLFDWEYHQNLALRFHQGTDYLPGDCLYFKNPEHHPKTPEWQGENAIMLQENLFYGHGIGITTKEGIITVLNTKRRPNPTQSAYLTRHIINLDSSYFSKYTMVMPRKNSIPSEEILRQSNMIVSKIGSATYLL